MNAQCPTFVAWGKRLQYLIEARELTSEYTHHGSIDSEPQRTTVEATGPDEAINQFVRESELELVSFIKPRGRESIATVKKDDCVYLVRVYAA
jgi:hypothetical protein